MIDLTEQDWTALDEEGKLNEACVTGFKCLIDMYSLLVKQLQNEQS